MSYTVTFTGTSSVLQANFLPPLELGTDYTVGLLSFDTYNTIPNIKKDVNDKFYFENLTIQIPEGSYDIEALDSFLRDEIAHRNPSAGFILRGNQNTLKAEIKSTKPVYFNFPDKPHSIGPLLGFTQPNYVINPQHLYTESNDIVKILSVNTISVHCNIASGSFVNGDPDHSIHQFFPAVEPGYKIIETPNPVIYYPTNVRTVDNITVRLLDQNGELIDFRGEIITLRLHLKKNGD